MSFNPLSKVTRCYYKTTKEIIEEHRSRRRRLLYHLDLILYLYAFRLFFIAHVAFVDFSTPYNFRRYDIPLNFLSHNLTFMDPYFAIVIFLFATFYVYCQRALYHLNVRSLTWRWWHQLVVLNQEAYWRARLADDQVQSVVTQREAHFRQRLTEEYEVASRLLPDFLAKVLCSGAARLTVWACLEDVDRKRLFSEPLSILPKMSDRLRTRLLLSLTVADYFAALVQLFIVAIFVYFFITQTYLYSIAHNYASEHPWFVVLWFAGEVCASFCIIMRLMHCAFFFTLCSIFGTIVYTGHVIDVGRSLKRLIHQFKLSSAGEGGTAATLPFRFRALLELQLVEHGKVCYLVLCGSEELFGKILFAFLMTNM